MSRDRKIDFVTADTHFDHKNIIHHCNRPFRDVEEMNWALVDNWNSVVNPENLVLICGDFAFRNHIFWLKKLNGKKILILGNHDKMNKESLDCFEEVHQILDTFVWGQRVTFCHYAMKAWNSNIHNSWHLYGHSHGSLIEDPFQMSFDIGCDVWNYTPISWGQIVEKMERKKKFIGVLTPILPPWNIVKEVYNHDKHLTDSVGNSNNGHSD